MGRPARIAAGVAWLWVSLCIGFSPVCHGESRGIELLWPEDGAVINVGALVMAQVTGADQVLLGGPAGAARIEFDYSVDGVVFTPITGPAPDRMGVEAVLWKTASLEAGSYVLRARLLLPGAPSVSDSITVQINEQPVATAEAASGGGLVVIFDGSASSDPGDAIIEHHWDFGDGAVASGPVVLHEYAEPGEYGVSMTVVDEFEGQSTAHYILFLEPFDPMLVAKSDCGCKKMTIKTMGSVEGPADLSFADERQTGIKPSEQRNLGAYNDGASGNQIDMSKSKHTVSFRFEVIADLVPNSKPQLCTEGQSIKRTRKAAGQTDPLRGPRSSDPRYDSEIDDDDPYDPNDDPNTTETGNCGFNEADFCDDDYHGGGGADGGGDDGLPAPSQFKKYIGQKRIVWLDSPGPVHFPKKITAKAGVEYQAKFKAKVAGARGSCECTWEVLIKVDSKGKVLNNEAKNINCS